MIEDEIFYKAYYAGDLVKIQFSWLTDHLGLAGTTAVVVEHDRLGTPTQYGGKVAVLTANNTIEMLDAQDLIIMEPV